MATKHYIYRYCIYTALKGININAETVEVKSYFLDDKNMLKTFSSEKEAKSFIKNNKNLFALRDPIIERKDFLADGKFWIDSCENKEINSFLGDFYKRFIDCKPKSFLEKILFYTAYAIFAIMFVSFLTAYYGDRF